MWLTPPAPAHWCVSCPYRKTRRTRSNSEPRAAQAWSEEKKFLVDSGDYSCYFQTSVRGPQLAIEKRLSTTDGFSVWFLREKYPFPLPDAHQEGANAANLSSPLKTSPSCSSGN